jgi:hypothetical protein
MNDKSITKFDAQDASGKIGHLKVPTSEGCNGRLCKAPSKQLAKP